MRLLSGGLMDILLSVEEIEAELACPRANLTVTLPVRAAPVPYNHLRRSLEKLRTKHVMHQKYVQCRRFEDGHT